MAKDTDNGWSRTQNGMPDIGAAAERTRTTTFEDVRRFTDMTGDRNPVHYDEAAASFFGGLVVQGGVTTGLLNAVVAEDLPGPGTVFLETHWKFLKAVKVGDTITARVEVSEVRPDKPICKLKTTIRNAEGEEVVAGTAVTYTVPLGGSRKE